MVFNNEHEEVDSMPKMAVLGQVWFWYRVCRMDSSMKKASYRTWVLIVGIAVAAVICIAALVVGGASSSSFSMTPRKPSTSGAPKVLVEKVVSTFDWRELLGK